MSANLSEIRAEREKWLTWKNIAPAREKIDELTKKYSEFLNSEVAISDDKIFEVKSDKNIPEEFLNDLKEVALEMKPWRKGPFKIFDLLIDAEWNSSIKYNNLIKSLNLKDKVIGDIGSNNGYYMLRMSQEPKENQPKKIIGFDPSPLYKTQFDFVKKFGNISDVELSFELLGVEHVEIFEEKFDTIFCLGVLYHRSDPIETLKSLKKGLNVDGELILDTLVIDAKSNNLPEDYCLVPKDRYAKMRNIYFVPTVTVLESWARVARFKSFEVLDLVPTTFEEQRKTEWIDGESLDSFLNPDDLTKTVENYPAPLRAYVKLKI